ncbi:MAG: hypothetical protein FWC59_03085 [Actinomycetia bacterium]|nr:hypothetical protein [Actinomycetes bacterium]
MPTRNANIRLRSLTTIVATVATAACCVFSLTGCLGNNSSDTNNPTQSGTNDSSQNTSGTDGGAGNNNANTGTATDSWGNANNNANNAGNNSANSNNDANSNSNGNNSDGGSATTTNTQRVGNATVGYVTIPADWLPFLDSTASQGMLQYSDPTGNTIISMNILPDISNNDQVKSYLSNLGDYHQSQGATGLSYATVNVNGITGYQTYCYYPDASVFLCVYGFIGSEGQAHYIAVEGPGDNTLINILDAVESTYSLTK